MVVFFFAVLFFFSCFSGCLERGEAVLVFYDELYTISLYPGMYSMVLNYSCRVKNEGNGFGEKAEFFVNPMLRVFESNREYETRVYEEKDGGRNVLKRALAVNLSLNPGEEAELNLTLAGHPINFFEEPYIREGVSDVRLYDLISDSYSEINGTVYSEGRQLHRGGQLELYVPESMSVVLHPIVTDDVEEIGYEETGDGWRVYRYRLELGHSFKAYVGDLIQKSEERGGVTVHVYLPREKEEIIPIVMDRAHRFIDTYSELFWPYPYREYTVISCEYERGGGGGYDNATVLFGGADDFYMLAHEVAHAWFGGILSTKPYESLYTEDAWLMEGGAEYCQLLMGEIEEREDLGSQLDMIMEAAADGNATENPYYRGAAVLWALQHQMGNEEFFSLMHELFERYHDKEITTQDFLSLVAEYGDYPMERWLYGPEAPVLKSDW